MHSTPLSTLAGTIAGEAAALGMNILAREIDADRFTRRLMVMGGRYLAHQVVASGVNVAAVDPIGLSVVTPVSALGHALTADVIENACISTFCRLE